MSSEGIPALFNITPNSARDDFVKISLRNLIEQGELEDVQECWEVYSDYVQLLVGLHVKL